MGRRGEDSASPTSLQGMPVHLGHKLPNEEQGRGGSSCKLGDVGSRTWSAPQQRDLIGSLFPVHLHACPLRSTDGDQTFPRVLPGSGIVKLPFYELFSGCVTAVILKDLWAGPHQ